MHFHIFPFVNAFIQRSLLMHSIFTVVYPYSLLHSLYMCTMFISAITHLISPSLLIIVWDTYFKICFQFEMFGVFLAAEHFASLCLLVVSLSESRLISSLIFSVWLRYGGPMYKFVICYQSQIP